MRRLFVVLSTASLLLAMMAIPVAADHSPPDGPDVDPTFISGNPSCPSGLAETKLEPVTAGTFPGAFGSSVQIVLESGNRFTFIITGALAEVVIVKGGPDANAFDYPTPGIAHDDGLHAPNRTRTAFYGLSHISFCLVDTVDAELTTTSNPNSTTVLPGTSVTDTATVTGVTDGAAPTGSVTFFLCQPAELTAVGCCSGSGTQVGAAKTLGAAAGNPPSVSVTSDATTDTATEGKYCWRAVYSGDGNYNATGHTNSSSECFTVDKATPQVETTSSETGTVLPGTSVSDTATVSGPMGAPTPTGTVTFFLCQPTTVTNSGGDCSADGSQVGDPVNLIDGSATSISTNNTDTEGKYCWRAEYSGNGVYDSASHTNSSTECFTVDKATPQIETTSSETGTVLPGTSVSDTATVTGVGSTTPTGTVTFFLCQPGTVTTNGGDCSAGGSQVGDPVTLTETTAPGASATSSAATNTTAEGKYCWRAVYSGDGVYDSASHTNSSSECFTVAKNTPGLTTDPWVYPNDTATFSLLAGTDDDDFGTVQFFLYKNDNTCTAGTHVYATSAITVQGNGSISTNNTTFEIDSSNEDTYYWQVVYGGDENNSAVTTSCTAEQFDIDFTVAP